jgi:short-subunit dehydrogenase
VRACIVYAAAHNADSVAVDDDRIVPVTLDLINAADVEAAAWRGALAANGAGALVNMLSIVSLCAVSFNASYCASKAAQWPPTTNALRVEING